MKELSETEAKAGTGRTCLMNSQNELATVVSVAAGSHVDCDTSNHRVVPVENGRRLGETLIARSYRAALICFGSVYLAWTLVSYLYGLVMV